MQDCQTPDELRKEIEAILENKKLQGVATKSKLYTGCWHGWMRKNDVLSSKQAEAKQDAFMELVLWLRGYGA